MVTTITMIMAMVQQFVQQYMSASYFPVIVRPMTLMAVNAVAGMVMMVHSDMPRSMRFVLVLVCCVLAVAMGVVFAADVCVIVVLIVFNVAAFVTMRLCVACAEQ
jgi:hypothetical protein